MEASLIVPSLFLTSFYNDYNIFLGFVIYSNIILSVYTLVLLNTNVIILTENKEEKKTSITTM